MAAGDKYSDYKHFFSNDGDQRGQAYAALFIHGANAVNQTQSILNFPEAYNLMISREYETKAPGMRDIDVHYEFTDFVIKTALYHKLIDGKALNSTEAQPFFENVVKRWNELSSDAQQFYKTFMGLIKTTPVVSGSPTVENIENFGEAIVNPIMYRINLKRNNPGEISTFGLSLPLFEQSEVIFTKVWYTKADGKPESTKLVPSDISFFRAVYENIHKSGSSSTLSGLSPDFAAFKEVSKGPLFNVDVTKIVRKALYSIGKAAVGEPKACAAEEEYCSMLSVEKDIWRRDENGVYFQVKDGKIVKMDVNAPEVVEMLKTNNFCYTSLVKAKSNADCNKYIYEYLLSNDPMDLEKKLDDTKSKGDFFDVARKEINRMHPIIALRTLQRFGFRSHTVYDHQFAREIKKVETVSHWKKYYLTKKFDQAKVDSMLAGNDKLICYLDLLSQFVNSNVSLLNKGLSGSSDESLGKIKITEYAAKLDAHGVKARKEPCGADLGRMELGMFKQYHNMRTPTVPFQMINRKFYAPFGGINPLGASYTASSLMMGGGNFDNMAIRSFGRECGNANKGSSFIKSILQGLYRALEANNKKLDDSDRQRIENKINKLGELEDEVIRTLAFIDEFNKLSDAFGGYKSELLTIENMEKFVSRYNKILGKSKHAESALIDIVEKLQKSTDGNGYDAMADADIAASH